MKVNGQEIYTNGMFAYDGCHRIYILEDDADMAEVNATNYQVHGINELPEIWKKSCPYRFISNWKLNHKYVEQCCDAKFDEL